MGGCETFTITTHYIRKTKNLQIQSTLVEYNEFVFGVSLMCKCIKKKQEITFSEQWSKFCVSIHNSDGVFRAELINALDPPFCDNHQIFHDSPAKINSVQSQLPVCFNGNFDKAVSNG